MVEIMNFGLMLIKNILVVGAVAGYWLVNLFIFKIFFKTLDKILK